MHVEAFRCITAADLRLDRDINVFMGGNGAGKTSLLEAIHCLGRGRSFRAADNRVLIRSGTDTAHVSGTVRDGSGQKRPKVRISRHETEIHLDGRAVTPAELAFVLPLQTIHAEIGGLVSGPPEARRRLLDWGVFHVKHDYLEVWRQFRRALLQRNTILRQGGPNDTLDTWDGELARAASQVDEYRRDYFRELEPAFYRFSAGLLEQKVGLRYQRGWAETDDLAPSLRTSRANDFAAGYTRNGPHRADLQFEIESERSRWRASKGQQKLLGAALILAQCDIVGNQSQCRVGLLVDEPAADLDREHLARFIRTVLAVNSQVFIAALTADGLSFNRTAAMFHVEHGSAKALL